MISRIRDRAPLFQSLRKDRCGETSFERVRIEKTSEKLMNWRSNFFANRIFPQSVSSRSCTNLNADSTRFARVPKLRKSPISAAAGDRKSVVEGKSVDLG